MFKIGDKVKFRYPLYPSDPPGTVEDVQYFCGDSWVVVLWNNGVIQHVPAQWLVKVTEETKETTSMDIYNITTPFGLLDKATQEALKAHKKDFEYYLFGCWRTIRNPSFSLDTVYRAVKAPVVETINLYGVAKGVAFCDGERRRSFDTHKITFNIVEGVPDCNSIKMEELPCS